MRKGPHGTRYMFSVLLQLSNKNAVDHLPAPEKQNLKSDPVVRHCSLNIKII